MCFSFDEDTSPSFSKKDIRNSICTLEQVRVIFFPNLRDYRLCSAICCLHYVLRNEKEPGPNIDWRSCLFFMFCSVLFCYVMSGLLLTLCAHIIMYDPPNTLVKFIYVFIKPYELYIYIYEYFAVVTKCNSCISVPAYWALFEFFFGSNCPL